VQMWVSPGADVGESRCRRGRVPVQMWASPGADMGMQARPGGGLANGLVSVEKRKRLGPGRMWPRSRADVGGSATFGSEACSNEEAVSKSTRISETSVELWFACATSCPRTAAPAVVLLTHESPRFESRRQGPASRHRAARVARRGSSCSLQQALSEMRRACPPAPLTHVSMHTVYPEVFQPLPSET
jgi:hypothetical protein